MADSRITELSELLGVNLHDDDVLAIVDKSDTSMATSGTTKRIKVSELFTELDAADAAIDARLNSVESGRRNPLTYGGVGDGVADDTTEVQAAATALAAGEVLDLAGKTWKVTSPIAVSAADIKIRNGKLLGGDNRVLTVTGADCTVESSVRFERTAGGSGSAAEQSLVAVNAERFRSWGADYKNARLACLYFTAGACEGARVVGGKFTNTTLRQNSCLIYAAAGAINKDIQVVGIDTTGSTCADGILLFDSQRCRVLSNEITGMTELPRLTMTGWTVHSGNVYKTADRTDGDTRLLFNNTVQVTEETATPTAPGTDEWGISGGFLYVNLGGTNPTTRTMQSRITSGYGVTFYSVAQDLIDNLAGHNSIHDTAGFGIYLQCSAASYGNGTDRNTIRNTVTAGTQTGSLPFAAIGVADGQDTTISGDTITTTGTTTPGVFCQTSGTGKIEGIHVRAAAEQGIIIVSGTWQVSSCRARACGAHGFYSSVSTVTWENCDSDAALASKVRGGLQIGSRGVATPEGSVTAEVGSTFHRTDGGAGTTHYVKESGSAATGWVESGALMPWHLDFPGFANPDVDTNFANVGGGSELYGGYRFSNGTQNDEVAWDLMMAAGTWELTLFHQRGTNHGIFTASFAGVSAGTIDAYGAATTNVASSITGIVLATTGKKRFSLKMATKNGASSAYYGVVNGVHLRRTA